MTNIDFNALLDALSQCKNALIFGHSHPDGDCVGSAVALAELVEALGGKAEIMFPEPAPLRLEFLLGERPQLTELPEDLDSRDILAVDVASPTQLGYKKDALAGKVKIRIDHHDVGMPYADAEFVDSAAAAAGEILFDLWSYAVESGRTQRIPEKAAFTMFGAISSDTGCFKYANVTPATHLRAAKLIEGGVPAADINRLLFDTKDVKTLKAEGIANQKLQLFANGAISVIAVDHEDYADDLGIKDFETAIDIARSVRGVRLAAVVKAAPVPNTYRVSLRSADDTDVAAIAASFGGGGHRRAAGCTLNTPTAAEAAKLIIAAFEKVL